MFFSEAMVRSLKTEPSTRLPVLILSIGHYDMFGVLQSFLLNVEHCILSPPQRPVRECHNMTGKTLKRTACTRTHRNTTKDPKRNQDTAEADPDGH